MSQTRTYSAIAATGLAMARGGLRIGNVTVNNIAASVAGNQWLGFYTTTLLATPNTSLGIPAPPTNGQVPVLEIQLCSQGDTDTVTTKTVTYDTNLPLINGPVYCVISTTIGSYTAVSSEAACDIFIEVEEFEEEPPVLTQIGSDSFGAAAFTVWTDTIAAPSAAKALYDVVVLNLNGVAGQLYLQMFAQAPTAGQPSNEKWTWALPLASAAGENINLTGALYLNFGDAGKGGLTPVANESLIGSTNTNANTSACYFAISSTPTVLTFAGAGAAMISARYCIPTA